MKIITFILSLSTTLFAGSSSAPHLEGGDLSILWVIPFAGILLSIAIFPLVAPEYWHHNFGKISAFWAALFILPFLLSQGWQIALYEVLHVGLLEYVPFIILLLALFTISGGVQLTGSLVGTPIVNSGIIINTIGRNIALVVQKKSTPFKKPKKSGGSPNGVSDPPMFATRKMKNMTI